VEIPLADHVNKSNSCLGAKVSGNESSREQKFHVTFAPGNKSSKERKFQGEKVPGSESTREQKFLGTFAPGSESTWERKFRNSNLMTLTTLYS